MCYCMLMSETACLCLRRSNSVAICCNFSICAVLQHRGKYAKNTDAVLKLLLLWLCKSALAVQTRQSSHVPAHFHKFHTYSSHTMAYILLFIWWLIHMLVLYIHVCVWNEALWPLLLWNVNSTLLTPTHICVCPTCIYVGVSWFDFIFDTTCGHSASCHDYTELRLCVTNRQSWNPDILPWQHTNALTRLMRVRSERDHPSPLPTKPLF